MYITIIYNFAQRSRFSPDLRACNTEVVGETLCPGEGGYPMRDSGAASSRGAGLPVMRPCPERDSTPELDRETS
jgi:hypothetical protein